MKRGSWKTRFGFYLAAIGSACGLGNLWRFPYVVGENGGGAFVLLYGLLVLTIGLPLLIGELMLGKSTHRSILKATENLIKTQSRWHFRVATFSVIACLVILSYYAVISGWVLHFTVQFLMGTFDQNLLWEQGRLEHLMSNGWLQMGLASVHLILAVVIVLKGVQEGLEKWISAMMPVFAFLLIILVVKSLSLDSAPQALRFLLYPDFSKLTLSSLLNAIGHVCFTLSVGFGTMVTFGSYLRDEDHIPTAGFRVAMVDSILSIFAGLLLFPVVLEASNIRLTDPGLLFEALPRFLLQMPGGVLFGLAFFLCLYLAALGASIGLLEVVVSNAVDSFRWSRGKSTWICGSFAFLLAAFPALSSTVFRKVRFLGRSLLENLDDFIINFFLPMIALGVVFMVIRGMVSSEHKRLFVDPQKIESEAMFPHWIWVMKYFIPASILFAFFLKILSWF